MSNPSNLYAEKVFSEHPIVLWALDDKADYITLISEAQRDISDGWSVTNAIATVDTTNLKQPFPDSILNNVEGTVPSGADSVITLISADLVNFTSLNTELGTFSVGSYFYSNNAYLKSIEIGYEYTDSTTSEIIQHLKKYETNIFQAWSFISGTFTVPNENSNLRAVIKITSYEGGSTPTQYQNFINGVSVGQWSEEFNATSLGVTPVSFPTNIALSASTAIEADAYGLGGNIGYYLIENNALLARNSGIPMVFGASGITRIIPHSGNRPSLVIPGKGFLNQAGQYKEYTVEFWARISSNTYTPKRIFGPIASTDGLYVEGGFLTLVIGTNFKSHFVGEWFRPMLIDIRLIKNKATVLINGEEVIDLDITTDSLILPASKDETGDSQDWLGFYAYEDVTPIEIDCVGIYSYSVPATVAKRRWVYGQGVLSPEGINSAYGGTSAFVDYPFANYTANYTYPNFAQWDQGTFDNLTTTTSALTTPEYSLPTIYTNSKTLQSLYNDNKDIQDINDENFLSFRPNSTWDTEDCYINFPRFNIINDQVHTVYGVFSSDNLTTEETLLKIYNPLTGNSFSIRKDLDEIYYYLVFNGIEQEIYRTDVIVQDRKFAVGIQIEKLVNTFGADVAAFFGNQNGLNMYVGGEENGIYQFTGKIYSVGISSTYNANELGSHFEDNGTAILDSHLATGDDIAKNALALLAHTASYTLIPSQAYNSYFLDIGVSGYWEDYMPLSYFAKNVKNDIGNEYYDLDFLQFNIGYPSPTKLAEYETTSGWTYQELHEEYEFPLQRTYEQLDNFLFTGWRNYEDMEQKAVKYFEYDTKQASIRSFITFQYIVDGANATSSSFSSEVTAKEGSIIDMDLYPNWSTSRFEVIDNTIIYPTKSVDFNDLAVVYHLEFNIRGILSKPIKLRRLELASESLNDNSFNPIGTRFGVNLFPYTRSGLYYDYKAKNPFSIYKGSTPYLYLTRSSGIEIRGDFATESSRGIAVPINGNLADNYRVSAAQLWMRYDQDQFPLVQTEIFEIRYKGDTIKFYMIADNPNGTRAKIYAKKLSDNTNYNGISYFINGSLVREPVITIKEWAVLGLSFSTSLNLDLYIGAINLTGPMVYNNVAYYQANNLQQIQSSLTRPWLRVKTDGVIDFDWQYWINNYTWEGVLVISASELYGVSPSDVYNTYIGTNKIIIDDNDGLIIDADKIKIYSDTSWSIKVGTPV